MFTAADFTAPATKPKIVVKCRRCNGTGVCLGRCFLCRGYGSVYRNVGVTGAPQYRAQVAAQRAALLARLRELSADMSRAEAINYKRPVLAAWTKLQEGEPQRFAAMLASMANGRVDAVATALRAY